MKDNEPDYSLDALLGLNGQVYFIDQKHWVKFEVKKVPKSEQKPHGLDYSLTLHDKTGERLVGFDNAHAVDEKGGPGKKKRKAYDHKHRLRKLGPYDYKDPATLLEDFWKTVDEVLKERGIEV